MRGGHDLISAGSRRRLASETSFRSTTAALLGVPPRTIRLSSTPIAAQQSRAWINLRL